MQSYISACLFFLPDVEELPLPPPPPSTTSACRRETSKREQLCQAGSGEVLGGFKWKWQTIFSVPSPPLFASHCVLWSCIWVYTCRPGRFSPSAPEKLRCIMPAGPVPGRISRGEAEDFSRGKHLQTAFWEESRAQIYICGPQLRITGKPKCCKSKICRVSNAAPPATPQDS